ncbi:MAG: tRNA pseudouridine(13) synthase TruD, partial [bacterium]
MTIRRTPDDFRVDERNTAVFHASIALERSPSHPFVAYRLVKRGIATPDAVGFVARALRVGREHVAAAGLKDRHAVTSQIITVDGAALRGSPPRELGEHLSDRIGSGDPHAMDGGSRWSIEGIGFVPRAADSTIIEQNAFTIVVRGLDKWHADEMARRASMLVDRAGGPLLVVNYFGDQRFGSARHGKGFVARALVAGDFESALRLAIGTPARKDSGAVRTMSRALATHWGDWKTALAAIPRMPERGAIEVLARGGSFLDAFAALPRFTQEICVEA